MSQLAHAGASSTVPPGAAASNATATASSIEPAVFTGTLSSNTATTSPSEAPSATTATSRGASAAGARGGVGSHRRRVGFDRSEVGAAPTRDQPAVGRAGLVGAGLAEGEPTHIARGRDRYGRRRLVVPVADVHVSGSL